MLLGDGREPIRPVGETGEESVRAAARGRTSRSLFHLKITVDSMDFFP